MLPPPSTLSQQKFLAVGEELRGFSPGFPVYGIVLNNDTGNWLSVNETFIVPPWTYGWSQPLPGTQSVSITLLNGPSIIPSVSVGTYVTMVVTEDRVGQSNGFTAVTSASISSAVTIAGAVSVTGTVGISGGVDVSGSNVNANITNTVTITGTVNIGTIAGGTVNIGTVTGDVSIIPGIFQVGGSGVTKIAVTGTRVALRASTAVKVIIVKARSSNVGTLYVGDSTVTNNETATTGGLQLDPGDMVTFTETEIADIFINGTAGDGVSYMFWT